MMIMATISGANEGNAPIPANEPALVCREAQVTQPFHYWRGASGQRYLHTVFPLFDCPLMPRVNFILVQRDRDGTCRPLDIGQTVSHTDSLNLAHLRRKAALLGANEIHIHFLPETVTERAAAEADLSSRQLGRTSSTRSFSPANDEPEAVCA
jgi:hypothetical protein